MKRQHVILALLVLSVFWQTMARADTTFLLGGSLADTYLSGIASPTKPTLFSGSLSATLGYVLGDHIMLGATTAYQWSNQYSDPAPPTGNWRGTRWNFAAPTIALIFGRITLQGDYEFLGNYNLSTSAADGSTVSYKSPSGFEASLAYGITPSLNIGAFYRGIAFTTQESSSGGSTTLGTKFKVSDVGLMMTYALFGAPGGH